MLTLLLFASLSPEPAPPEPIDRLTWGYLDPVLVEVYCQENAHNIIEYLRCLGPYDYEVSE